MFFEVFLEIRDLIIREHDRHIVFRTIRESHVYENVTLLDLRPPRGQDVSDCVVRHHIRQSVRTQQQRIVISEPKMFDDHPWTVATRANDVRQDVLDVFYGLADWSRMWGGRKAFAQSLIECQLDERALSEKITAGMAHVRHEQIRPSAVDASQCCGHPGEFGVVVAPLQDGFMSPAVEPFGAFNDLRRDPCIDSHVPLSKAQREMSERADGEPRCH
jgi:hypothetical protein